MLEAFWLASNVMVGVPLAVAGVVGLREVARALIATMLGFRVFEIKWGVGRRLRSRTIGPVDLVVGALPLSVSIVAESGSARHHLRDRLVQAAGPLALQVGVALWLDGRVPPLPSALREGVAPAACLHVANAILVFVHALLPLATSSGDRTDVRWVLDEVFGAVDEGRHARGRYYARLARHALERGDSARARAVIEHGLTQLGRDPLLVGCAERLAAQPLASVVDQSACSDRLRALIEEDTPNGPERRSAPSSPWIRLRRGAIALLPLTLVGIGGLAAHPEHVARFVHGRLVASSAAVAAAGVARECEAELVRWGRWMDALDAVLASDAATLRDRHAQLARLEHCRGDLDAALAHQLRANAAAEAAAEAHRDARAVDGVAEGRRGLAAVDPAAWLADELDLAALLRQTAEIERERRRYRQALAALGTAAARIDDVQRRLEPRATGVASSSDRATVDGESEVEGESARIASARAEVLARMRVH
jgi:hypothetical protein